MLHVKLQLAATKQELASHCIGLTCSGLPQGRYAYRLERPEEPLISLSGTLEADSERVWLTLLEPQWGVVGGRIAEPSRSSGRAEVLEIRTRAALTPGKAFLRLVPVFSGGAFDVPLDADGVFRVTRSTQGMYALVVLEEGRLVHASVHVLDNKAHAAVVLE